MVGLAVFLSFGLNRLAERIAYGGLLYVFTILLLVLVIARFTRQLNEARRALPEAYFAKPEFSTTTSTWIVGAPALFVLAPIFSYLALTDIRHLQRVEINPDKVWIITNGGFTVATDESWSVAKSGTYSDGSAVAEFGMVDYRSAVVFDHHGIESAASIADYRREDFLAEFPSGSCQQRRWLRAGTLELRSEVICTARSFGDPVVMMSLSISDEERHIEVYGNMNSSLDTEATAIAKVRRLGRVTHLTATSRGAGAEL